jgi:hypothetical protein
MKGLWMGGPIMPAAVFKAGFNEKVGESVLRTRRFL